MGAVVAVCVMSDVLLHSNCICTDPQNAVCVMADILTGGYLTTPLI
jgi:hypothetical protein